MDALAEAAERVCVITNTVQRDENRDGRITHSLDLIFGVALPNPNAAWDWEIAPFSEIGRNRRLIHRVRGYPDTRAVRA